MSKGAYKYSDVSGSKCMSSSKGAMVKAQGKMSSAHGTNGQSTNNNMQQNAGNSVGHSTRTFRSGLLGEAGYKGGGTAHAKQPKGSK